MGLWQHTFYQAVFGVRKMDKKIIYKIKTAVRNHWRVSLLLFSIVSVMAFSAIFLPIKSGIETGGTIQNKEIPIYCVDSNEKKVALSFDAAWGNEDTKTILEILEKYDVKVTFFMTGGWVESYPEDVKAIAAAGHDLGNHSENHKHMSQLGSDACIDEIMKVHEKVKELTGKDMCLFRPPYGDYNDTLINSVYTCGYYPIQWDVDSLDWKDYGADNIVKTVLHHKNLGNGSIILMHNGAKYTKDALEQVIVGLKEMGYEIVPISQLIYTEEFTIDHTGRQKQK